MPIEATKLAKYSYSSYYKSTSTGARLSQVGSDQKETSLKNQ